MTSTSRGAAVESVPVPASFRSFPKFAALATAAIAGAGLLTLAGGLPASTVATPRAFAPPSAAAALVCLSAALAIWMAPPHRWGRIAAWLTALAASGAYGVILVRHSLLMPSAVAFCLVLFSCSLLLKPTLPNLAAGFDLFVLFVAFLFFLARLFQAPVAAGARPGSQPNLLTSLCLLLLTCGWLAAFPQRRPAAYFLESGSAGWLLRRVLPLTLVFPLVLVWSQYETRHAAKLMAKLGSLTFLLGAVAFWVALIWLVSHSLDRLDATHAAARAKVERDVAERGRAKAKLNEREEQVRLLLDSTGEGIYYTDRNGTCVWCNAAAARILGYAGTEALLGRNMHDLIHHTRPDGSPLPRHECRFIAAGQRAEVVEADEELLWRADGTSFYAEVRSYPVLRQGHLDGLVATFADASRRRRLEDQVRQAQKMDAVGRLAAGVAHDFNNLLTVINGYCDLLIAQSLPAAAADKIANIRNAGEKAAELTHQLLAFSRKQVLQPKVLDLNAVLADVDKLLRRVIGEDVQLQSVLSPRLASVRADPSQLQQVIINLAVNGRDAMPKGGKLTIETAAVALDDGYAATHPGVIPGPYIMLAVTDTGAGMDAETLAHVFEPFFTTKPAGKGTGLGLATVFGVVKQSGGNVAIYSEPGHGTSVKVYLPAVDEPASLPEPSRSGPTPRGRETVLVVEDELVLGALLQEVLESAGYTVLRAMRPEQAIALEREHAGTLDLLVSDVILPGMSGREVADCVLARRPQIRVLFISGYPDKAIVRNGELEPDLAFLQKPFTPAALVQKVRQILDRSAPLV